MELKRSYMKAAVVAGGILGALALSVNVASATAMSAAAAKGERLAFSKKKGSCITCHQIKGGTNMGNVAPVLNDMKKRFSRKELYAIIWNETKRNPQTVMPAFGHNLILTHKEIEDIIDFLYTR